MTGGAHLWLGLQDAGRSPGTKLGSGNAGPELALSSLVLLPQLREGPPPPPPLGREHGSSWAETPEAVPAAQL